MSMESGISQMAHRSITDIRPRH